MVLDSEALSLLKELTESFGPAGFERDPLKIVRAYMEPYADEFLTDKLGSVVFRKTGDSERPRILLAGHVDEVGFIITGIEKETGFLTFSPLGGWFDQVLLSLEDCENAIKLTIELLKRLDLRTVEDFARI